MKRLIDLIFATIALIFISPLLVMVSLIIKLDSSGPIFYRQQRLGKNEKAFLLLKFRTMTHKARLVHRQIYEGDSEVTRIGAFLRRAKIDELPQLLNVIVGNMSIVGPRPCLPEAKSKFGKYAEIRFKVRPGLTSLAAVKGSIYLTWPQKGIYDYLYVKNESALLDLYILCKTLKIIFFGEQRIFGRLKSN